MSEQQTIAAGARERQKDVVVGAGRVPWGTETETADGRAFTAGWVLPGGARTTDRDVATTVARNIDRLIG